MAKAKARAKATKPAGAKAKRNAKPGAKPTHEAKSSAKPGAKPTHKAKPSAKPSAKKKPKAQATEKRAAKPKAKATQQGAAKPSAKGTAKARAKAPAKPTALAKASSKPKSRSSAKKLPSANAKLRASASVDSSTAGGIEIQVARRYAEQMAKSASEAATADGNARWLVEDLAGLFAPEHEAIVEEALAGAFFDLVCHCVIRFQERSQGELVSIFDHAARYFAPAGVTFCYEGGEPPALVPKGFRFGAT